MCIYCGGHLAPDQTDYIENDNNHVVFIKDVPCEKCRQCGETFFNNNTVLRLEKILEGIAHISSEITLTVLNYVKIVA